MFGVGFSTTFGSALLADVWGDRAGMTAFWLPRERRLGAASSADRARALSSVIEAAVAALPGDPMALRPGALHLSTAHHEGGTVVVGLQRVPESIRIPALAVVVIPEDELVGYFRSLGALGLAAVGALLLMGVAVAVWVAHRVARPLRRVADELGRVGEFDLSDTERLSSRIREVATVGDATAKMKGSLRSFARYVPTEVVRDVLATGGEARLGGTVRSLTLFFSDIQGFTSLSEGRPPQAVVEELGAYLAVVTAAITGSRGTVDKFVGDGIVAFFNAPREDAAHAASACRAALGVQAALAAARPGWAVAGRPAFPTRIGLHTADVVVGNIGTPERFAYTVIGDGANYASRLEALNKEYGTWILASRKTRDEAGPGFAWRRVDRTTVAGRAGDDDVFELLGLEGQVAPTVLAARDAYEAAFVAYLERRFPEAAAGFDAAATGRPGDRSGRRARRARPCVRGRAAAGRVDGRLPPPRQVGAAPWQLHGLVPTGRTGEARPAVARRGRRIGPRPAPSDARARPSRLAARPPDGGRLCRAGPRPRAELRDRDVSARVADPVRHRRELRLVEQAEQPDGLLDLHPVADVEPTAPGTHHEEVGRGLEFRLEPLDGRAGHRTEELGLEGHGPVGRGQHPHLEVAAPARRVATVREHHRAPRAAHVGQELAVDGLHVQPDHVVPQRRADDPRLEPRGPVLVGELRERARHLVEDVPRIDAVPDEGRRRRHVHARKLPRTRPHRPRPPRNPAREIRGFYAPRHGPPTDETRATDSSRAA